MANRLALALLDVLTAPVPPRLARWLPSILFSGPAERATVERLRARLERERA